MAREWTDEMLQELAESVHLHLELKRLNIPEGSEAEAMFLRAGRNAFARKKVEHDGNVINASALFALKR